MQKWEKVNFVFFGTLQRRYSLLQKTASGPITTCDIWLAKTHLILLHSWWSCKNSVYMQASDHSSVVKIFLLINTFWRASLVVQWFRISQGRGHRFNAWSGNNPRATGQLGPGAITTQSKQPRASVPQQEKPPQWEAHTRRVAPALHNQKKPAHSNKDPTQPKK